MENSARTDQLINRKKRFRDLAKDELEDLKRRSKTRVFVLYTGGTIGMVPSDPMNRESPLRPGDSDGLSDYIRAPDGQIFWHIEGLTDGSGNVVGPLDSSSVGPVHWKYMANSIERVYNDFDGFVILHGTDTMAFTASALSFLLQNLGKPVILTGSQLPVAADRTDAVMNFTNALHIAGYAATGLPKIPEVAICFGDALLRGNRTTKVSTSRWQGFNTPNYPWLGRIGEHIVINQSLLRSTPNESSPFFAHKELEVGVATVALYPGMDHAVLASFLSLPGIKGFILRTFGNGNAPDDAEFLSALSDAIDGQDQKIVVNTTQCLEGTVEMGLYESSSGLQAAGVVTGLDLTPEAALTKLMWLLPLLAGGEDRDEVLTQMQIDQRGEQTGSVFDVRYGAIGNKEGHALPEYKKAARPSGQFQTQSLKRATLRIDKLEAEMTGGEPLNGDIVIHVFIDLPSSNINLATDRTPQYAGRLTGKQENGLGMTMLLDVTKTVARVHETGRPLHLSLILEKGQSIKAKGVYLTLFNV